MIATNGSDLGFGPDADHTVGDESGHYLIAEATGEGGLEEANLLSPSLREASSTCQFSFWYFMDAPDERSRLEVKVERTVIAPTTFMTIKNPGQREWIKADVLTNR